MQSVSRRPAFRTRRAIAIGAVLIVAAALLARPSPIALAASKAPIMNTQEMSYAPMLEKAMPAVVSIRTKGTSEVEQLALLSNPIYNRLIASETKPQEAETFSSFGSGVIVDAAAGLVVTNYHVIESANEIKVRLNDGREFDGTLIGSDPAIDVAVVRIKPHKLIAVPLGESLDIRIGDLVFAVGNPLGLDSTATFGMISALRRTGVGARNFEAYIQHDASVNRGNSGGALLNLKGELIGINTAIISPSGGSVGLGFAIPIGYAKRVWDQLVKYGHVRRGHIGVKTIDTRTELFDTYGLASTQGAFVLRSQSGSPADMGGLEFADVVTGIALVNNANREWVKVPVQRAAQLEAIIAATEIGDEVRLDVLRGFEHRTVAVRIVDMKPEPDLLEIPANIIRLAGVVVQPISSDNPVFGKVPGVEVVEVKKDSLAEIVGLKVGDVMTQIDRAKIRVTDDVVTLTKDKTEKFDVSIMRNGKPYKIQYPL